MLASRLALLVVSGAVAATACILPSIDAEGTDQAGAGAGGKVGTGGGAGPGTSCDPSCSDANECGLRVCADSSCTFVAEGTAIAAQTGGDCRQTVCDGAGNVLDVSDDADVPAPADCLVGACSRGTPTVVMAKDGTPCGAAGRDLTCEAGVCQGCADEKDCGKPPRCSSYVCVQPNQPGTCSLSHSPAGTACESGTYCQDAVHVGYDECDGNGSCIIGNQLACDPHQCLAGGTCGSTCFSGSECAPGADCQLNGSTCQDCRTCAELAADPLDDDPICSTSQPQVLALHDCACSVGGPCVAACNTTLCLMKSPQGIQTCADCIASACMMELADCQADTDPYP
jgi:hypothetical protein